MLRRSISSPQLWLTLFVSWAAILYFLSSFSKTLPEGGPEIPHIDKVLHFGYFLGGGIILATYVLLRRGASTSVAIRSFTPLAVLAIIGALDEYHQTFTPGRSGNDPFDWLADVLGAAVGIATAHAFHTSLLKLSSRNLIFEEK